MQIHHHPPNASSCKFRQMSATFPSGPDSAKIIDYFLLNRLIAHHRYFLQFARVTGKMPIIKLNFPSGNCFSYRNWGRKVTVASYFVRSNRLQNQERGKINIKDDPDNEFSL